MTNLVGKASHCHPWSFSSRGSSLSPIAMLVKGLNSNEAPSGLGNGWAGARSVEFGDGVARVHLFRSAPIRPSQRPVSRPPIMRDTARTFGRVHIFSNISFCSRRLADARLLPLTWSRTRSDPVIAQSHESDPAPAQSDTCLFLPKLSAD